MPDQDARDAAMQMEARERAMSFAMQQRRMQQENRLAEMRQYEQIGGQELKAIQEEARIEKEKVRLKDSIQMQQDKRDAFQALSTLPKDADLDSEVAKIEHSFPLGVNDPTFRNAVQHRYQEASTKLEAQNKLTDIGLEYAKQHGINYIAGKDGLPDIEAMRSRATELQKLDSTTPAGMIPSETTVSSSGEVINRFTNPKDKPLPAGIVEQHLTLTGQINDNQSKYDSTKPANDPHNAPLIPQYQGLVSQRDDLERLYPQLKPISAPAPSAAPQAAQPTDPNDFVKQALQ